MIMQWDMSSETLSCFLFENNPLILPPDIHFLANTSSFLCVNTWDTHEQLTILLRASQNMYDYYLYGMRSVVVGVEDQRFSIILLFVKHLIDNILKI